MIANKSLLQELFRAFHIQRWNDRIRPMDLIEMDKHAHKMIIAYCIGKYEEDKGIFVDWNELIKNSIFELLRRITISDIKSPIFSKIKRNRKVFEKLNRYIYNELEPKISDEHIKREIYNYLFKKDDNQTLTDRILEASHIFASYWEFRIIKNSNPQSYQTLKIETELLDTLDKFSDLEGIRKLTRMHTIYNFIDLFGQLRFQYRWAQLPRIPKTSVLGHSLMVACIAYLFARENNACDKRIYNDFFGGLFHDLPEAVTRDILSPVKRSSKEFENLLKTIEKELTEQEILTLIEPNWHKEIEYFITDEFANKIIKNGKIEKNVNQNELDTKYNKNQFSPYDGQLIKAADNLAAFLEVWNSCNSGIKTEELQKAVLKIKEANAYKIGKIDLSKIYEEFYS